MNILSYFKSFFQKEETKLEINIMESAQVESILEILLGYGVSYAVSNNYATQPQADAIKAGLIAGFDVVVALEAKKLAAATTIQPLPAPATPVGAPVISQ